MGKREFCVLIKHYFLRGKTFSETKAKLDKYYSDSASSHGTIQKWFTKFRCGRTSTETIPSPGHPNKYFFLHTQLCMKVLCKIRKNFCVNL